MNMTTLIAFLMMAGMVACTSGASAVGTAPGLYQGPNLDGSAGFIIE